MTSPEFYTQATRFLASLDHDWANLIETVGPCTLQQPSYQQPYEALVRAVAYQQLHPRAGDAILARLLALHQNRFPEASQLLEITADDLRACGFSMRKIDTLYGIANAALDGTVPTLSEAKGMSNEALIEQLITLKGIGRWTVEMMLIFTLQRMDVLAAADYGLALGYQRLKHLPITPTPKQLAIIGQAWQPYRTVASWYLWRVPKGRG